MALLLVYSWEEKLPTSKSSLENTWLYHEIGRCHLEMHHAADARQYGERSLEAATEAGDELWQLNACVLIAQSHGLSLPPTLFISVMIGVPCCNIIFDSFVFTTPAWLG